MDSPDVSSLEMTDVSHASSSSSSSSSRPMMGFPLGTALLLVVVFSLSGAFYCCYRWEKVRSLRRRPRQSSGHEVDGDSAPDYVDPDAVPSSGHESDSDSVPDYVDPDGVPSSPPKPKISPERREKRVELESLPVIMPGDKLPTFMARPCPCEPLPPPLPSPPVKVDMVVVADVHSPLHPLPPPPPPPWLV